MWCLTHATRAHPTRPPHAPTTPRAHTCRGGVIPVLSCSLTCYLRFLAHPHSRPPSPIASRNSHRSATSPTADGTYVRDAEVFGTFSHEVNAVREPSSPHRSGDWALFFTAALQPNGRPVCNCTDGSTPAASGCGGTDGEGATFVSWSESPTGPWSTPLQLISVGARQSDTNLAPVLRADGSLVGIWRTWDGGSWPHLVTASNWKDPKTYVCS